MFPDKDSPIEFITRQSRMMVEQPHFDDERTVLTAQPVVPLQQIDAKLKHRRRWFLGGAFALAMFLGAASALVSAYFKLRNVSDPEMQSISVSSEPEPEAVTASALPVVEEVEEQPTPTPTPAPKRPKVPVRNTEHTNHPIFEPRDSEEDDLERIRDAVLTDEWQERRQRRAERRAERRERRQPQHRDRDLSNLDEIFEGPRRRP